MILCQLLGHKNRKFLVDGDGIHLSTCCIVRMSICSRCGRQE